MVHVCLFILLISLMPSHYLPATCTVLFDNYLYGINFRSVVSLRRPNLQALKLKAQ